MHDFKLDIVLYFLNQTYILAVFQDNMTKVIILKRC